jgi:formylglycine-generating enzyme
MVSKCPEGFVYVKGGTFQMGSTEGWEDETPVHEVTLTPFCMMETEVTNTQWDIYEAKKDQTGFELIAKQCGGGTSVIATGNDAKALIKANNAKLDGENICGLEVKRVLAGLNGPDQPKVLINWFKAEAYCESIGGGLPTEAQWEFAATAGGKNVYGTKSGKLKKSEACYDTDQTCNVKVYPPNKFGLYGMTGNVWEWTNDWYSQTAYETLGISVDPKGPATGEYKVARGGSWDNNFPSYLCAAYRWNVDPEHMLDKVGFRCVAPALSEVEGALQDSLPAEQAGKK